MSIAAKPVPSEEVADTPPQQCPLEQQPREHHCVYCPNCSARLWSHRCKLMCRQCGYYLSCADFY